MNQIAALTQDDLKTGPRSAASVPATAANRPAPAAAPAEYQQPAPGSLIEAIFQMAARPDLDMDRFGQLMEWQRELEERQAKVAFISAMKLVQSEIKAVWKNRPNSQTKSRYADYEALNEMVQPIYTKHGFIVTYDTEMIASEMVRVFAHVEHEAGHSRRHHIDMPCDGKGAKGGDVMTKTHAVKSAVTYGKGTLLPMIFNITLTDSADDDGNGASEPVDRITPQQVEELRAAMAAHDVNEAKFCEWAALDSLESMSPALFEQALRNIRVKKK